MSSDPTDSIERGRIDLVPMIDCIMLLLLFFIMTTKFSDEEKGIPSLLSQGSGPPPEKPVEKPNTINIIILPAAGDQPMPRLDSERAGQTWYTALVADAHAVIPACDLRIGGREPLHLTNRMFDLPNADPALEPRVARIHAVVRQALAEYEVAGKDRKDQPDIVIHAFSGLSWRYALLAYDACRAYEGAMGSVVDGNNPDSLRDARAVSFAPPRIRGYSRQELGAELFELQRLP
jgi:hypothetical protein